MYISLVFDRSFQCWRVSHCWVAKKRMFIFHFTYTEFRVYFLLRLDLFFWVLITSIRYLKVKTKNSMRRTMFLINSIRFSINSKLTRIPALSFRFIGQPLLLSHKIWVLQTPRPFPAIINIIAFSRQTIRLIVYNPCQFQIHKAYRVSILTVQSELIIVIYTTCVNFNLMLLIVFGW